MQVMVVGDASDRETGFVGERLADHGAVFTAFDRDIPAELAAGPGDADLLLLLGSDAAVYDPTRAAVVAAELALVHRAQAAGRPILGICYGGQLLARAAGASVTTAERPEIGWTVLETEDDRLAPAGPWYEFHADRWWPTASTPTLARTGLAPQAFRWGRALGVQFHPEVGPAAAAGWVHKYTSLVTRSGVDPEQVLEDIDRLGPGAALRCTQLVDAFLEDVAGQTGRDQTRSGQ